MQLLLVLLLPLLAQSVDKAKFRKCDDTGFCHRHRNLENKQHEHKYSVILPTVDGHVFRAKMIKHEILKPLDMEVSFMESGSVRLKINEDSEVARYESPDVLLAEGLKTKPFRVLSQDEKQAVLVSTTPEGENMALRIGFKPFRAELFLGTDREPVVVLNPGSWMYFEQTKKIEHEIKDTQQQQRKLQEEDDREIIDWGEDGKPIYADSSEGKSEPEKEENQQEDEDDDVHHKNADGPETFGGFTDSRPHGATSIGMDILFANSQHVYGIPEHATQFSLKNTRGNLEGYSEPYRLYNLDVFEYELDLPMALYGSIPMMTSHTTERTTAVFWNNPTETFVDVWQHPKGKATYWMSESGVLDLFLFPGPKPLNVIKQYSRITGTTPTPPSFAIGYHQCRWNYRDEKDVREVNSKFEEHDFPYDVLWLDIEHTDGKRYFTWDKLKFPTPVSMQENIAKYGRQMVNIVDPHIKVDDKYYIHKEAQRNGYYIKNKDNKDFDGWCWPGKSSYLDFTSEKVREFWQQQFALDKYQGSTDSLFIWNDMNEPSVFNGPEVSIPKDCKNLNGNEFREFHNLYGFYFQMATSNGIQQRSNQRPFVLSRAFFAGSQRYGAIWTGDNAAEWSHLRASVPMILSASVAGLPFIGADVGGFFGNPEPELLIRWYQAGALQPFFRGHSHIDTKRREPWLFGDETLKILRHVVRLRYTMMPYLYSVFEEASSLGYPVMRPLWMHYPAEEDTFTRESEWLLGEDLLVAPVMHEKAVSVSVYFPGTETDRWFNIDTYQTYTPGIAEVSAPLTDLPVFYRGGSIVPRKMRARRSTTQMLNDPYTLVVSLNLNGNAAGNLYIDDERSFAYKEKKQFCRVTLNYSKATLTSAANCEGGFAPLNTVERIIIIGEARLIQRISLEGRDLQFKQTDDVVVVRKPEVAIRSAFSIIVHF